MPPRNIKPPQKAPTKEELAEFCQEKGFEYLTEKIFDYYEANSEDGFWFGGDGRLVRSWKQKLIVVWFDKSKNPKPREEAREYGGNIKEW